MQKRRRGILVALVFVLFAAAVFPALAAVSHAADGVALQQADGRKDKPAEPIE